MRFENTPTHEGVLKLLDIGRRFVTDFLDISPQQRQRLLGNVHALTGIAIERLAKLGDTTVSWSR